MRKPDFAPSRENEFVMVVHAAVSYFFLDLLVMHHLWRGWCCLYHNTMFCGVISLAPRLCNHAINAVKETRVQDIHGNDGFIFSAIYKSDKHCCWKE